MGAFLRSRSPRGVKKYALRSRRVQWLGPLSPSAGGLCYRRWGRMRAMGVYSIMRRGGFRPRAQAQVGKVVVYGSDGRGGSCFNDMLNGRKVVGIGSGAIGARRCYARMRSPRAGTVPKNTRGEWGRVTIVIDRVKNVRSRLPLIRVMASLMP